jgi:predicted thioesterase
MKNIFKKGDYKVYKKIVLPEDQATFHGEVLHPVCSTFALARDMEWSSRLFFIDLKETDEEGVGTYLEIQHRAPAFVGEELTITAIVDSIKDNELMCSIEVKQNERLIAIGKTGQRMLKKERLNHIFAPPTSPLPVRQAGLPSPNGGVNKD